METITSDDFEEDPETTVEGVCFAAAAGCLSDEPRTIEGTFPGNRKRAMGHALYVENLFADAGIEAHREYVEEVENGHRIDVIVE